MITIQKTKTAYHIVDSVLGTLFQSHNKDDLDTFLVNKALNTDYTGFLNTTIKPIKYGKLSRL